MSRLSIYETRWIDLVFENRNKEYGAYQLRQESVKSSLQAYFMGLLFITSVAGITLFIDYFKPEIKPEISISEFEDTIIHVTDVVLPEIKKTILPEVKKPVTEATIVKDQLINPTIIHPDEAVQDVSTNIEIKNSGGATSNETGTVGINPTSSGTGAETKLPVDTNILVNTTALDKLPEFPGGMDRFYSYVGNNFERLEIEGINTMKLYVSFVIEKDGNMTNIHVKRDPGYGLGKEAIRVLKSLRTKWTPGMINSKPVRTAYDLPITVEMNQ
jgi:protein TonB